VRLLWQRGQQPGDADRQARTAKARRSGTEPGDLDQPAPGLLGEAHRERRETGASAPQRNGGRQLVAKAAVRVLRPQGGSENSGSGTFAQRASMMSSAPDPLDRMRGRPGAFIDCRRVGFVMRDTCVFAWSGKQTGPSGARPLPTRCRNIGKLADGTGSAQSNLEVLGTLRKRRRHPASLPAGNHIRCPPAKRVVAGPAPRASRGPPVSLAQGNFHGRGAAIGGRRE